MAWCERRAQRNAAHLPSTTRGRTLNGQRTTPRAIPGEDFRGCSKSLHMRYHARGGGGGIVQTSNRFSPSINGAQRYNGWTTRSFSPASRCWLVFLDVMTGTLSDSSRLCQDSTVAAHQPMRATVSARTTLNRRIFRLTPRAKNSVATSADRTATSNHRSSPPFVARLFRLRHELLRQTGLVEMGIQFAPVERQACRAGLDESRGDRNVGLSSEWRTQRAGDNFATDPARSPRTTARPQGCSNHLRVQRRVYLAI